MIPTTPEPFYPPARALAERLQALFASSSADGEPAAVRPPEAATLEAMIGAAFWASLRREEGRAPKISLALVPPERVQRPLLFETAIPLQAEPLAKLAPAVERPGIHLGVWGEPGALKVWGTARDLPPRSFVLEVVAPGLLVVKAQRPLPSTKFANVAVLEGAQVKFLLHQGATFLDAPPALGALHAFYASGGLQEAENVFVQLGISMRAHGRGGSVLVVPADSESWRASIVPPISYSVTPPFAEIADLLRSDDDPPQAVRTAVDALAGLTAVDGATIIDDTFRLLAFGAKIARRPGAGRVEQVLQSEPIEGAVILAVDPTALGGTRHLSAAQFVHDQRDGIALVASQDGRFTVFAWSPVHGMVHAHRLETLLL